MNKDNDLKDYKEIEKMDNLEQENNKNLQNDDLITVRPVKFQEFDEEIKIRTIKRNLEIMQDINIHIKVELGKTQAQIKDVMDFEKGSVIELDKVAGEQVEIYANDKLIAKGEVIVIEDNFGVRITTTNVMKTQN